MFRRIRQRRAYKAAMAFEIERVGSLLDAAEAEITREVISVREQLRDAPGMCPRCGQAVLLRRALRPRSRTKWFSFYGCTGCSATFNREQIRRVTMSFENEQRDETDR